MNWQASRLKAACGGIIRRKGKLFDTFSLSIEPKWRHDFEQASG
jgi:hypothetical protein